MGVTIIGTSHARTGRSHHLSQRAVRWHADPAAATRAPRAPTNLQTAPFNGTRIDLTWTDNAGDEQGFRIEPRPRRGGVAGMYVQIASVAANVTTYPIQAWWAIRATGYRVRAYNALGNSGYSNEAWAMVTAPLAPTALVATAVNGVRIDWRGSTIAGRAGVSASSAHGRGRRTGHVRADCPARPQLHNLQQHRTRERDALLVPRLRIQRGWRRRPRTSGAPPQPRPTAPTLLQATAFNGVRIDLAWTDNATDELASASSAR